MKKGSFNKRFALRCGVCFFVVLLLFLISVLRILSIDMKDYKQKQKSQSTISLPVDKPRGSILDTNGIALTNSKMKTIAAISPTKSAISAVKGILKGEEAERVLDLLNSGKPAVCELPEKIECDGITCVNIPVRITENTVAHHFVGYLDGDGNGADGIEKAYNDLLSDGGELTADFAVNGKGDLLLGVEPEFSGGRDTVSNAVYLTIDINIQKRIEEISAPLKSGAVVVADCKTNRIRAAVSLPDFSPYDISASFNEDSSPLLNKCISCYNVGSAFKPCIAAVAIEEGLSDYTAECAGRTVIEKRVFNCHKAEGHGFQTLSDAIKNSCNCYFYNLAITLGSEKIYKSAEYFSFGSRIKLAENVYANAGNLPKKSELQNNSDMANFGIGQGDIMLSPVSMLNLYSAIANGGEYHTPSIIEKTVSNGKTEVYNIGAATRGMSKSAAETIKKALVSVIEEGTGTAAKSEIVTAAGKTATAQTGRIDQDGNEIKNRWFCGFFPVNDPQYTIIIMADGEHEKSPAHIFKEICEYLYEKTSQPG